jgi:hypothetical protein
MTHYPNSTLTIPYTFKHHPRLALTPIKTQVYGSVTSSWETRSSVLPPCATGRAQAGSSTCHVYIAMTMCTFCHRWLRKGWCIHWEKTRGVCWIIPLGMRMRELDVRWDLGIVGCSLWKIAVAYHFQPVGGTWWKILCKYEVHAHIPREMQVLWLVSDVCWSAWVLQQDHACSCTGCSLVEMFRYVAGAAKCNQLCCLIQHPSRARRRQTFWNLVKPVYTTRHFTLNHQIQSLLL